MKYRKKVNIEAKQVQLIHSDGVVIFSDGTTALFPLDHEGSYVKTLEGPLRFQEKDWIATGIKGEQWAIKPDIFNATYERVEE